ncbi:enolase 2-like [Aristolochia californica]|uniref:enolase 2-like n=1 Tax=Aristolochia californica TaxID=171875 RepID=UPI0035E24EAA
MFFPRSKESITGSSHWVSNVRSSGPFLVHLDFQFGDNPGAFHIFTKMAGRNENVGQAMLLAFSHNRNAGETWVVREMVTIKTVKARQVFDSRGNPTVEVDIICSNGTFSRAAVLNGASTGISEPLKLNDGGSDYLGKGVFNVVENVNAILGPALFGKDPTEQTKIDNFMVQVLDGTVNEWDWCKPKLGATAILAVSLALCKAEASVKNLPLHQDIANLAGHKTLVLVVPAFNLLNGGSPAGNKLALQEFMILPVGASSFKEAM